MNSFFILNRKFLFFKNTLSKLFFAESSCSISSSIFANSKCASLRNNQFKLKYFIKIIKKVNSFVNLCIRSRTLTSVVNAFRIFPRRFVCNNGKHKFHKLTQPV